jgi:hypothetical protein
MSVILRPTRLPSLEKPQTANLLVPVCQLEYRNQGCVAKTSYGRTTSSAASSISMIQLFNPRVSRMN